MLLGQAKVVRYYPYYQRLEDDCYRLLCYLVIYGHLWSYMTSLVCRVLDRAKSIMLDLKYVNNAEDRAIFLTDIEKLKKVDLAAINSVP
jgi:hypothetical protein